MTKSSQEAIRSFASFHDLQFRQAIAGTSANQRGFEFSGDQFDAWAVAEGYLPVAARDAADHVERSGIVQQRYQLRIRMNRVSRQGAGLSHAYSIEARAKRWRVVLIERFLVERPAEVVSGIRGSFNQSQRSVAQAKHLLSEQEGLSDTERMLCAMRLEMAEMYIFNGLQAVEMVVRQVSGEKPDLKALRKAMAAFWMAQERKVVRKKGKRAA